MKVIKKSFIIQSHHYLLILPILLSSATFSVASELKKIVALDIAVQPLETAITELAKPFGIQLLFKSLIVDDIQSHKLVGDYTFDQAISELIKGTPVEYRQVSQNTYVIIYHNLKDTKVKTKSAPIPLKELQTEIFTLPEIVSVGENHRIVCCRNAPSTATKSYVPTMEIPRSMEGIDEQLFQDRSNATLMETFRDYSSVNVTDQSGLIILRGFRVRDQSILKSGLPSVDRGISPLPLQNIEGIEIAKGANSPLFGNGQPGGVINLIMKSPKPNPFTNVGASYGNYDQSIAIDTNGPTSFNEDLWQRFNILLRQEREHNTVDGDVQQIQFAGAQTYHLDGGNTLFLNLEYNKQNIEGLRGHRAFDQTTEELAPLLDLMYPNLVEVPFYPYSGPEQRDTQDYESYDFWGRFEGLLNDRWDYTVSMFSGKSKTEITTVSGVLIWYNYIQNPRYIPIFDAMLSSPNFDEYQANIGELADKYVELFQERYAGELDFSNGMGSVIYDPAFTPAWSDDKLRFYQEYDDIPKQTDHSGLELNLHGMIEQGELSHDLTLGLLYQHRQWNFEAINHYSGELYELGNDYIDRGEHALGFALRRAAFFSFYFPYGPAVQNMDIVLPDKVAALAGIPAETRFSPDSRFSYSKSLQKTRSLGVYLQDLMSLGKWHLLMSGGYYTYYREDQLRALNAIGLITGDFWFDIDHDSDGRNSAFTPSIGLTYSVDDSLSLYASRGEQFDISEGLDSQGNMLEPEETTADEIGIKWWPLDEFNITLAQFNIEKKNYAIPGNSNGGLANVLQSGAIESKGQELSMSGFLTPHYKLSSHVTHTVLESDTASGVTDALLSALLFGNPEKSNSIWLQYHTQPYGKRGWSAGIGANYLGARGYQLQQIIVDVDSVTIIDASLAYKNDDFRVVLGIDNLFNKTWITGGSAIPVAVPDSGQIPTQTSALHLGLGYGTRVRLTTELNF